MSRNTVPHSRGISSSTAAAKSGMADKYWLELMAYPEGTDRSLWFSIGGKWKKLDNPSKRIESAVVQAFATDSNHQVKVWYEDGDDDIVGLVVCSK